MRPVEFGDCVKGSWREATGAVTDQPFLFLVLFTVMLITSQVTGHFTQPSLIVAAFEAARFRQGQPLLHLLMQLGNLLCILILSAQVIRYTLLGPLNARAMGVFDWSLVRYVMTTIVAGIAICAVGAVIGGGLIIFMYGTHRVHNFFTGIFTCIALLIIAWAYAITRIEVMLCDAAIGERHTFKANLGATRGRFWTMWLTHMVVGMPLFFMTIGLGLVLIETRHTAAFQNIVYVTDAVRVLLIMAFVACSASCSAWLYRRFTPDAFRDTAHN